MYSINSRYYDYWRWKWHPTPVLLPGKFHGWRNLVGYSPWDCKESDTTEWFHFLSFYSSFWRRKWQPTPVFLPGESHGQRGLVGYSSMGLQRVGHDWATNTHYDYILCFVSQPKERRHDTHEYFIILILVDLLFHLKYSLPLVLWHDILRLLFLPSQFPLLILLPLLGLSPSVKLYPLRSPWGPSMTSEAPETNPVFWSRDVYSPHLFSEFPAPEPSSLPAISSWIDLRWSLCHLEESELKTEIQVQRQKALLAQMEFVPILLAISDLLSPILWFH